MSILDALRRQLLGQAAMMRPGQGMGGATQGILGQGGRFGGGLMQTRMNQPGGLLGGQIPELALLGSALYGQGIQGKDPLEGLFPAYTQAAQLKSALTPQREKLMTAYDPKTGKTVFATRTEIEQKGLEPIPEVKESSLSKEALALYERSKLAPDFNAWLEKLPDNEKQLWNKYIKGNEDIWTQMLKGGMPKPTDTNQTNLFFSKEQEDKIRMTMDKNPSASREDVIKALKKANEL